MKFLILMFIIITSCGKKNQISGKPLVNDKSLTNKIIPIKQSSVGLVRTMTPEVHPNYYQTYLMRDTLINQISHLQYNFKSNFNSSLILTNLKNKDIQYRLILPSNFQNIYGLTLKSIPEHNPIQDFSWNIENDHQIQLRTYKDFDQLEINDFSFTFKNDVLQFSQFLADLKNKNFELIISTPQKTKTFYFKGNGQLKDALDALQLKYSYDINSVLNSIEMDHTLYSNHIGKWIFLNFSGNIHENLFAQNSYVLFFLTNSELINLKNIYQPSKFFLNHIGGKTLKLSASQRLSRYTLTFSQLMHYPVREVILPYKEKLNFKLVKKPFDQYQLNKVLINKMKITSLPNFKINFDKGIISFNADQSFKKIFVTVPKIKKESIENKCSLRICVNKRRKVQKIHDYILDITISPIIMP